MNDFFDWQPFLKQKYALRYCYKACILLNITFRCPKLLLISSQAAWKEYEASFELDLTEQLFYQKENLDICSCLKDYSIIHTLIGVFVLLMCLTILSLLIIGWFGSFLPDFHSFFGNLVCVLILNLTHFFSILLIFNQFFTFLMAIFFLNLIILGFAL